MYARYVRVRLPISVDRDRFGGVSETSVTAYRMSSYCTSGQAIDAKP